MAAYLIGQVLRTHPQLATWLQAPEVPANGGGEVDTQLDIVVASVADVLARWHEQRLSEYGYDDYKVDFKRENVARSLGKLALRAALPVI